jgi:single-strand DNA-binding protein
MVRNEDSSTSQESERHRVIVRGLHTEKAARLLRKGSKVRVQGRMTYPTWKDKQSGATRYGAEIVAQTLDYQGANDETEAPAKPKRRRAKKAELAAA